MQGHKNVDCGDRDHLKVDWIEEFTITESCHDYKDGLFDTLSELKEMDTLAKSTG